MDAGRRGDGYLGVLVYGHVPHVVRTRADNVHQLYPHWVSTGTS